MTITLVLDGEKFQVEDAFANLCGLVNDVVNNMGMTEVPLEDISKPMLQSIL